MDEVTRRRAGTHKWIKKSNYMLLNWISNSGCQLSWTMSGHTGEQLIHRGTREQRGHTSLSRESEHIPDYCSVHRSCFHTLVDTIVYISFMRCSKFFYGHIKTICLERKLGSLGHLGINSTTFNFLATYETLLDARQNARLAWPLSCEVGRHPLKHVHTCTIVNC